MPLKGKDEALTVLARELGPEVVKFAEYAAGEMDRAVFRHALAMGCNIPEAEGVALLVVAAAVRTMSQAVKQAMYERRFRQPS